MTETPPPGAAEVPELEDQPRRDRPALLLVRHGETTSNVAGALDTALPGAALTERGREQARALGLELREEGLRPVRLVSSEALRARETAALVGEGLGVSAGVVPGAFEVQAGDYEMRSDPDAIAAYDLMLRAWLDTGEHSRGLPGGESADEVRARILPVVDELGAVVRAGEGDAVLVVHGTLMRLAAVFLGVVPARWAMSNRVPNCGVIELAPLDGAGWECVRWGHGRGPLTF